MRHRIEQIRRASFAAAAALATLGLAGAAGAQVVGFGGSAETGWTPNASATTPVGLPSVAGTGTSGDVLTLTTAANSEATTYWYDTPQDITNFSESFTYTDVSKNGADGIGVVWQNNTSGVNTLGGGGGLLGFTGLTNTAAYALNIYSGNGGSASGYNGLVAAGNPLAVPTPGSVNIDLGDPINITLNYQQVDHALSETMLDTVTSATYTRVWRSVDIQGTVGGSSTALIGFTGATGGVNANQTITNFQFTSGASAPIPAAAISPINGITGWNENMIVSKASGSANLTATVDNGTAGTSNTLLEQGVDAAATAAGVPQPGVVFGSVLDPNHSFVLQPNGAGQNDALMLDSTVPAGALTLSGLTAYSELSFLVVGANGGGTINATINYLGGGTQTAVISAPDWFNNGPVAYYINGRASLNASNGTYSFNNILAENPRFYQEYLALTDTTDPVTSISVAWGGTNREIIFGLSGTAAAPVPEPVSLSLLFVGGAALLRRRRSRVN